MVGDILQPTHLLFVLVVALLVLGPKRLPEVAKTLGNGLRDFRSALSGDSRHDEDEPPRNVLPPEEPKIEPGTTAAPGPAHELEAAPASGHEPEAASVVEPELAKPKAAGGERNAYFPAAPAGEGHATTPAPPAPVPEPQAPPAEGELKPAPPAAAPKPSS